ncbi:MAG: hypothetical protein QM692_15545, partial [Thermomicrobiales bacterium]
MSTERPRVNLTRRQMLGGACAVAGIGALGQGARGWNAAAQSEPATPHAEAHAAEATPVVEATPSMGISPTVPGLPYVQPPTLQSENGRLDVEFTAQLAPTMIGGREVIS